MCHHTRSQEVESIFAEAIKVEPNGLEAFAQYAQLKSMLGEYEASLTYLEKALGNARSRDEVIRILHEEIACHVISPLFMLCPTLGSRAVRYESSDPGAVQGN